MKSFFSCRLFSKLFHFCQNNSIFSPYHIIFCYHFLSLSNYFIFWFFFSFSFPFFSPSQVPMSTVHELESQHSERDLDRDEIVSNVFYNVSKSTNTDTFIYLFIPVLVFTIVLCLILTHLLCFTFILLLKKIKFIYYVLLIQLLILSHFFVFFSFVVF